MVGYSLITTDCEFLMRKISQLNLTQVFPFIFKETDAGPGVGVNNIEVRYRDIELARIHNSDIVIHAHQAPHDSGVNAAERSNAVIGDAIVDGGTVDWQHYMPFDGLTDEVISNLTTEDVDKLKKTATERNAWWVAH